MKGIESCSWFAYMYHCYGEPIAAEMISAKPIIMDPIMIPREVF